MLKTYLNIETFNEIDTSKLFFPSSGQGAKTPPLFGVFLVVGRTHHRS